MFPPTLLRKAAQVLEKARAADVRIATAETCTGGLISACLTAIPCASRTFDRGYVLYHSSAKASGLGIPEDVARLHGAVSAEVTALLAEGALRHSGAQIAVSLTGYAGPGGGNETDPVGTVYAAVAYNGLETATSRHAFRGGRDEVRIAAVEAAVDLLEQTIQTILEMRRRLE